MVWPEPASTAAGVRMMQIIDVFQKQGYTITVASSAGMSDFSEDLIALGIHIQDIKMNDNSFDVFVKELDPGLVLFDRFLTEEQFGWRVAEQVPDAVRILDTEDLHSLRYVREQSFRKDIEFTTDDWVQNDKTKREIASIYRCDLSLIISSYEMELLTNIIKIDKSILLLFPLMANEITEINDWPSFNERTHFIFIGGGKHAPNVDAITYLKVKIWPLIHKQLPEAQLHIYGAYLPQQVLEYHNHKEGFLVKGRASAVQKVMSMAKVCLAPLRFGAGIKGKLLHAMQFGTPSVTTSIGAEGMQGVFKWNGTVVNEADGFAQAAVDLYLNETAWNDAQRNGMTLINGLFNKSNLETLFLNQVQLLQKNLHKHRQRNFIGALLQHQTMAATKFMGKWITEKKSRN